MKRGTRSMVAVSIASAFFLALGVSGTWANEASYGNVRHTSGGHRAMGSYGMGMMHSSTGHLIRHLLKHETEIGLTADQVAKLKNIQLNLDRARIRAEADIQIAERELRALTDDEQSDFGAIEAKLKESEDLQVSLRMTSIKTRREVLALLTPEQRAKEKAEHEKMMQQHRAGGKGYRVPHGSAAPYGANPHGSNPHGSSGSAMPTPPSNMGVQ